MEFFFCTLPYFLPLHLLLLLLLLLPSTTLEASASIKWKGSHRQRLCYSWKFNVEVNNLRGWSSVPDSCESYVASYMTGDGYLEDSKVAITQALDYATSYNFSLLVDIQNDNGHGHGEEGEGRRQISSSSPLVWIFDIDETSLSNLPYYAHHHFGYVCTISPFCFLCVVGGFCIIPPNLQVLVPWSSFACFFLYFFRFNLLVHLSLVIWMCMVDLYHCNLLFFDMYAVFFGFIENNLRINEDFFSFSSIPMRCLVFLSSISS